MPNNYLFKKNFKEEIKRNNRKKFYIRFNALVYADIR